METLLPIAHKLEEIEIDPYVYLHPAESSELLKRLKPCDFIFSQVLYLIIWQKK